MAGRAVAERARLWCWVVVPMLICPPDTALAQEVHLKAGTRIRVTVRTGGYRTYVGSLLNITSDTLWIVADSAKPAALSIPAITVLERSIGHNPWLIYGVPLAGGIAGAFIGARTAGSESDCLVRTTETSECKDVTSDTVAGIGAGIVSGAILAKLLARERWREIQLAGFGPLIESAGRGARVGARLRF